MCVSKASQRLSSLSTSTAEVSQQRQMLQYSPAVVCPSLSADVRPSGRPVGTARDPPLAKVSGTVAGLALAWDTLVLDLDLTRSIPPCPFPRAARNPAVLAGLETAGLVKAVHVPHPVHASLEKGQEPYGSWAPTSAALPRALQRLEPSRMSYIRPFFKNKMVFVSFS